jgi:hypothetical protein
MTRIRTSGTSPLAIFRFPEGIQGRGARPELILISSVSAPCKVRLDAGIDSARWGLPVISRAGVVGVVTYENSVAPIAEVAKTPKFRLDRQQASAGR